MNRAHGIAAGIIALSALALARQDFIFDIEGELPEGLVIGEDGQIMMAEDGAPSDAEPSEAANKDRLKRFEKLKFDRRPSAILKAWSTPPKPPEEEATEDEQAEGVEGAEAEEVTPPAEETTSDVPAEEVEPEEQAVGEETVEETVEEAVEKTEEELKAEAEAAEEAAAEAEKEAEKARKKAEKEAEDARKKAEKEAAKKALDAEMELFQRNVTLGLWDDVTQYLTELEESEGKAGYTALMKSLVAGPPRVSSQFANWSEKNHYEPTDVSGLALAAPFELEAAQLDQLAKILAESIRGGSLIEQCVAHFHSILEVEEPKLEAPQVARMFVVAGFPVEAGEFLPTVEEAVESNDRAALNLLSRHHLAMQRKEPKGGHLEEAWKVNQAVLADGEVEDKDKEEALKRAVDIAPQIREELGQAWLDESFTARPERGMEILSVIGSAASQGLVQQGRDSNRRFKGLELQTTAANALLKAAPERAGEWQETLNLLAGNWLTEAQFTYQYDQSTRRGPALQRDPFGNFFYYDNQFSYRSNMPQPISTDEMLDIRPSDEWLGMVAESVQPKFAMVVAQLLLKVNEETEAFPHIEQLALTHPERAKDLVEEFLRVWARNHNPNTNNQRTNSYMFIYGFEERSSGIPLTRSKQERNLAELGEWIARLRKLPIPKLDEKLIASAFTAAHSTAEVYRVETIEQVFGELDDLEPKTLAELVQKMRSNLVGVWRDPALQKEKKTKRRQKDIQNEVLRGYEVAAAVVDRALEDYPEDWSLRLAQASVMHDENNYRQEVAKSSEFVGRRHEAFALFAKAAELYHDQVDELEEVEETTKAYETWYYASLGACDLNAIDHEKQPVVAELEKIRDALQALPGETSERHVAMFANSLFTRMSSVNPAVKFRYVRTGLDIVGDHERAEEVREIFEYYRDLVTEIRLETVIDGADRVGHTEPFGVFVNLRHTREIEREAGGFSKYLINQNNQAYAYNYGRPTENYRDKFEEAAREALKEHFEVHSITFNHPDTHSRATEQYGWRVTPYAYLLLQARGPEVDRLPPLRLDLDFLDTSGYCVLPAESSAVVVDATAADPDSRVYDDLAVTQILDERQAADGRLLLEIKATALGLVPSLETFLDLSPEEFDIVTTDDQGVSVSEFDQEGEGVGVLSERTWMVAMQAEEGLVELPEAFQFGVSLDEEAELVYQRYVDADLASVEPIVPLEARYGETTMSSGVRWSLAGGALLVVALIGYTIRRKTRPATRKAARFSLPDDLSPFLVIGLLNEIDRNNGVSETERNELRGQIANLERHYFGDDGGAVPDLRGIAESWAHRVPLARD